MRFYFITNDFSRGFLLFDELFEVVKDEFYFFILTAYLLSDFSCGIVSQYALFSNCYEHKPINYKPPWPNNRTSLP